jgi:hypothetical protein
MNPENPDEHKVSQCDWVLIDGYSLKAGTLAYVIEKVLRLASKDAMVVILNASGVN